MDRQTIDYYNQNAEVLYHTYQSVQEGGVQNYFQEAFPDAKSKILDIGSGSGRDLKKLLELGYDAYGIDGSEELIRQAKEKNPILLDRIVHSYFPLKENIFSNKFDGILFAAILMHIPRESLFDSVYSLKALLKEGGKVLLSIPEVYHLPINDDRDENGRLFLLHEIDYLELLFERVGFRSLRKWKNEDSLGRSGTSWVTILFELEHKETLRPLDKIEGILNRDKKQATYKLALFRSLCEISKTAFHSVKWDRNGKVQIPINLVVDKWIKYYWKLIEASSEGIVIPQNNSEATGGKSIVFKTQLKGLIDSYRMNGGYHQFMKNYLNPNPNNELVQDLYKTIKKAIINGPVTYSGLSSESGRIFEFNKSNETILMPSELWKEINLMSHWLEDAIILRWAELSSQFSGVNRLKIGNIIEYLIFDDLSERDTRDARTIFDGLITKNCVWTDKTLTDYDVDHILPFSLWNNNNLWNLMPSHPSVNRKKSDKLPTSDLLKKRKDAIIHYWEILYDFSSDRFEQEANLLIGKNLFPENWKNGLFGSLVESVEITAIQRGVERWEV
ncbi:MAG: methyltransferase domain-containing protein [Leptospiraceae bacterium]|nr:methyltransferase domain-containing protein [Leptospiraceae bacterium]